MLMKIFYFYYPFYLIKILITILKRLNQIILKHKIKRAGPLWVSFECSRDVGRLMTLGRFCFLLLKLRVSLSSHTWLFYSNIIF